MAPPLTAPTTDTAACRTFSDDPYLPGDVPAGTWVVGPGIEYDDVGSGAPFDRDVEFTGTSLTITYGSELADGDSYLFTDLVSTVPGDIITHVTLVGDMDAGVSVAFDSTSIGLFVEDQGRIGREGRVTFNIELSDPNVPDAAPAHAPYAQAIPATSTGALVFLAVLLLLVARHRI